MQYLAAQWTVGIVGSYGVLNYAVLALAAASDVSSSGPEVEEPCHSSTAGLLMRGFRVACNADFADIVLKAQPADGSVRCRVSADGFISLTFDDRLVWFHRYDRTDADAALWCKAAHARDVTLISGDYLRITASGVDPTPAAQKGTLVMAKIPTSWT